MNQISTIQPRSITTEMAARFGMEPGPFEQTLRATVVPKDCTREQFAAFLMVARDYRLNPITKEIYAFPTRAGGIQPIVSIDGWMNLMNSHPQMDGLEFEDIKDDSGALAAICCRIYRKDRSRPIAVIEYMSECKRTTDTWKTWPARMLRHKAAIQAARYAFGFSGIVEPDEFERMNDSGQTMRVVSPPPAPPAPPPAPLKDPPHAEMLSATLKRFDEQRAQKAAPAEPEIIPPAAPAMSYDERIADLEARLKAAGRNTQEEIFETEIEPYRESGEMFPPDYNRLLALVKDAAP